jgi:hypothetical protein
MTALLVNVRIDSEEKYSFFQKTFSDIYDLFDEVHVKIRGSFSMPCQDFIENLKVVNLKMYQHLKGDDWFSDTSSMVFCIESDVIFNYVEDHILLNSRDKLSALLKEFSTQKVDFMPYSFYRASKLSENNLLPLIPCAFNFFHVIDLDNKSIQILGKISPNYFIISLLGIFSKKYLEIGFSTRNLKLKIYSRYLTSVIKRFFPARHQLFLKKINSVLRIFNARLFLTSYASPHDLERRWDDVDLDQRLRIAIPKEEYFANYDDDNGAPGESLIKRALYPLSIFLDNFDKSTERLKPISFHKKIDGDSIWHCCYYPEIPRIEYPPIILIEVETGYIKLKTKNGIFIKHAGESVAFYSNVSISVITVEAAEIKIFIYDPAIQ